MKSIVLCAALLLAAASAQAAVHEVLIVGLQFFPDEVTIDQGDTVRWVNDGGGPFHTVTSGTGTADPEAGLLFDADLNQPNQVFEFVFTETGDVPYFCRPHVNFGMTGLVRVEDPLPNEGAAWSRVKSLYR